jgi:nucleotide-binding universal stress UspA family protein
MPGMTVGVDGSEDSQRALEWAMREAALRNAELTVLTVYEVAANHWTGNPMVLPEDRIDQEKAAEAAEAAVSAVAGKLGGAQPPAVNVRSVIGFAAAELIEASHQADLLVVGSRGGGGFARLLLGSISSKVVEYSACPVVVVPGNR